MMKYPLAILTCSASLFLATAVMADTNSVEKIVAPGEQLAIPEGHTSVTLVPTRIDSLVLRQKHRPLYALTGTGGGIKSTDPSIIAEPVEFHVGNGIFWEALGLARVSHPALTKP